MITILLSEILNDNDYANGGVAVYNIAQKAILNNDVIVIDMQNVDSVPTVFMNTSFGELMDNYGADRIKKSFKFRNILKTQVERISKYFSDYESLLKAAP
jgi:hypothetical protein